MSEVDTERFVKQRAEKRVLDTETGIYLETGTGGGPERISKFFVIDGPTIITLDGPTKQEVEGNLFLVTYVFRSVPLFKGNPRRTGYKEIIRSLLTIYGDGYNGWDQRGYYVQTELDFSSMFLKALEGWERPNG